MKTFITVTLTAQDLMDLASKQLPEIKQAVGTSVTLVAQDSDSTDQEARGTVDVVKVTFELQVR